MEKVIWLRILCRLFYVGGVLLVIIFFYLGMTGNQPGTNWRGGLLAQALLIGFLGLVGDVIGDIADNIRHK
jgi:hypothetical protein